MPIQYMNSMRLGFAIVFKWDNLTTDDSDIATYFDDRVNRSRHRMRNISVDRSGTIPTLRWEQWEVVDFENDGYEFIRNDSYELSIVGQLLTFISRPIDFPSDNGEPQVWEPLIIDPFDATYYWLCDDHGRAFSINDLLSPAPNPQLDQIQHQLEEILDNL